MRSITVRLDIDVNPFDVGAKSGLLWSRAQADDAVPVLAGIGDAARFGIDRPAGFEAPQRLLGELAGPSEVAGPGTGPVGFAAMPFDREAPGELIVPEIVVGRGVDGRRWLTVIGGDEPPDTHRALARVLDLVGSNASVAAAAQPTSYQLEARLAPEVWRDEIVAVARDLINDGAVDGSVDGAVQKVVLARELLLRTDQALAPEVVIQRLRTAFPSAIVFAVDGFVGASPELLVGRNGDVVRAHPLAGTAPRSSDPVTDRGLAAGLLASAKDRGEHRITIDWLLDGLLPFCSYVDAEPEPSIVSLANVHHLGTLVEGRLSSPSASVLELVAALHPTPAVGGDPQAGALEIIANLERADRGRYAGPVGWVDAQGNGSFAVGIRSAQMRGEEVRLFAGVGVVGDSDPDSELEETRSKFRAMLGALIQP